MTDEAKQAAAEADADKTAEGTGEPSDTGGESPDFKAEADKWKAMSRKHEAEAKANRDAAKKLADMEEASKSESQRLADKAALSDKAAADAQQELARLRVAMRKGLTEAQAKRLIGATEEELEADADELLATFATKDADDKDGTPTRPKEKLKSGATGAETQDVPQLTSTEGMTPAQIVKAKEEGRFNQLLGIK